jgi:hypothetical protein
MEGGEALKLYVEVKEDNAIVENFGVHAIVEKLYGGTAKELRYHSPQHLQMNSSWRGDVLPFTCLSTSLTREIWLEEFL